MSQAVTRPSRQGHAERSSASTEAMLNAAVELILEHGARVSMMAIGRRSGYSHGLVLARFGSKAGLIGAVTHRVQRHFTDRLTPELAEAQGLDGLLRLVDTFFADSREQAPISQAFYVLLGEALGADRDLREAFARADEAFRRYVAAFLEQAQALAELDPAFAPATAAALVVAMLRGTAMQLHINPDAFDAKEAHREVCQFIERLRMKRG